jgi:hypothetical protein
MIIRYRKLRLSIATVMALIAALSLLFLVLAPLYRLGPPPCLEPIPTARWLVTRPGNAHCADCHARPATRVGSLPAPDSALRLSHLQSW